MKHRQLGRAGLGIVAALTFAVAGCATDGSGNGNGDTDGDTTDDPAVLLAASADEIAATSFNFEMTMGELLNGSGSMDPSGGAGTMTMSVAAPETGQGIDMEIIFDSTDMWMSFGEMGAMMGFETEWLHLDVSRLGADGLMGLQPGAQDPAGATELLKGLGEVEQVDDRTFEGEVDLTQASGAMVADDEMLAELGDDATRMPFTAELDEQGRLVYFAVELPPMASMEAQKVEVRYFDFGTDVEITPPPAEDVSPAPDLFYGMFES